MGKIVKLEVSKFKRISVVDIEPGPGAVVIEDGMVAPKATGELL